MDWNTVGNWLKSNGTGLLGLAGAVATGNVPAGVAAVASLITEATGESNPAAALAKLQADPATMLKLEELLKRDEADIRAHHRELLRMKLEDDQKRHKEQQDTIRGGDNAEDPYVRHTRPMMARQSWYSTMAYIIGMELLKALEVAKVGAEWELAMVLISPAAAYLGFRTADKVFSKKA